VPLLPEPAQHLQRRRFRVLRDERPHPLPDCGRHTGGRPTPRFQRAPPVTADLDLRVGGTFFYGFRGPKVPETWALWQFTEVEAPRRLGLVISFTDANRNVAPSPFGGPWPARIAITVTLERHAGIGRGTLLTLRSTPLDASDAELAAFCEAMSSMEMGWGQTLESLAGFLSTSR
jgi:uncharacterized protein YndB with AHSA1/START domain